MPSSAKLRRLGRGEAVAPSGGASSSRRTPQGPPPMSKRPRPATRVYTWLGSPIPTPTYGTFEGHPVKGAHQYYLGFVGTAGYGRNRQSVTCFVGDFIYCQAVGNKEPYLGFVEGMWSDKQGNMSMRVRWFYRMDDFPPPTLASAGKCYPLEVFLSSDWNNNRVSIFLEQADIVLPDHPYRRGTESRGREWCTREVDAPASRVGPLSSKFLKLRKQLMDAAEALREEAAEGVGEGDGPASRLASESEDEAASVSSSSSSSSSGHSPPPPPVDTGKRSQKKEKTLAEAAVRGPIGEPGGKAAKRRESGVGGVEGKRGRTHYEGEDGDQGAGGLEAGPHHGVEDGAGVTRKSKASQKAPSLPVPLADRDGAVPLTPARPKTYLPQARTHVRDYHTALPACVPRAPGARPSAPSGTVRAPLSVWMPTNRVTGSMTLTEFLVNVGRLLGPQALAAGNIVGANLGGAWSPVVIVSHPRPAPDAGTVAVHETSALVPVVPHVACAGRYIPLAESEMQMTPLTRLRFRSRDRWFSDDYAMEVLMSSGYNTDVAWEALVLRMMNAANSQFHNAMEPELLYRFATTLIKRGKTFYVFAKAHHVPLNRVVWQYYSTRHLHAAMPSPLDSAVDLGGPATTADGTVVTTTPHTCGTCGKLRCLGMRCTTISCASWTCAVCLDALQSVSGVVWKEVARVPYWLCKRCQRFGSTSRRGTLSVTVGEAEEAPEPAEPLLMLRLSAHTPNLEGVEAGAGPVRQAAPVGRAPIQRQLLPVVPPPDPAAAELLLERVREHLASTPARLKLLFSVLDKFQAGKSSPDVVTSQLRSILRDSALLPDVLEYLGIPVAPL